MAPDFAIISVKRPAPLPASYIKESFNSLFSLSNSKKSIFSDSCICKTI